MTTLPHYLYAPVRPQAPVRHALGDYEVTHLTKWKIAEWLALGGALAFIGGWFLRYIIGPIMRFLRFLRNFAAMPQSIATIRQKQEEIGRLVIMARSRSYALFDSATHPIWESDGDGHCIFANTAMLAVLGLPFEAIAGDNWRSVVHYEDREEVTTEWLRAVTEHRDFQMEYRWVGANDRIIGIRANARRIMDGQNVIGYISNVKIIH